MADGRRRLEAVRLRHYDGSRADTVGEQLLRRAPQRWRRSHPDANSGWHFAEMRNALRISIVEALPHLQAVYAYRYLR
jgi:hypothetical protein